MYHSVASPERRPFQDPAMAMPARVFEAQMAFLARHRQVISLDDLVDIVEGRSPPQPGAVVITFDDGYLDNYELAAPILSRHGLPATIFLATGSMDHGENMWVDVVFAAFKGRTRQRLRLNDRSFALDDPREADRAYRAATSTIVRAPKGERGPLLDAIHDQLQPDSASPRLMMTWSEVRALTKAHPQICIGSHSREHFSLSGMSREEVCEELAQAHADIRRELGIDAAHFAFPYGHDSPHARSWLREHGYRTASLTEPLVLARTGSEALALRRLEASQDPSLGRFAYHTSGAHPSMSEALLFGRS